MLLLILMTDIQTLRTVFTINQRIVDSSRFNLRIVETKVGR